MTETHEREMTWTVREDTTNDTELAHLSGIAVPWNSPTSIGNYREQFAPGSFDVDQVVGRPLYWRHAEVIGKITRARDTETGLDVDATILPTRLGSDAMILLRGDAVTGLSVGFEPMETDETDGVITRTSARLIELSLTPVPAYAGATVTAHRETENTAMKTTPEVTHETTAEVVDTEAREAVAQLADTVATMTSTVEVREAHPLTEYRSFGEYLQAVGRAKSGETVANREILSRALDVATTATNPGTIPPAWIADIERQINDGRPTVTAIGRRALPANGMTVTYREVTQSTSIAEQATEATEVASQALTIAAKTAEVATYAGAVRVSMQEVMRSDPSYLSELRIDMISSWNKVTNNLALNTLALGTGTGQFPLELTTDAIGKVLGKAAADIAAGGGRMSTVICPPSIFYGIAAVAGQGYLFAGGAVANAGFTSGSYSAFGTRFIMDPQATNSYAFDPTGIGFWESGPYFMQADEPATLTRDLAAFSYNAQALMNPTKIVVLSQVISRTTTTTK